MLNFRKLNIMCRNKETINISQEYFIKHLIKELKKVNKELIDLDNRFYGQDDFNEEWNKIRKSNLKIGDIIDALE